MAMADLFGHSEGHKYSRESLGRIRKMIPDLIVSEEKSPQKREKENAYFAKYYRPPQYFGGILIYKQGMIA